MRAASVLLLTVAVLAPALKFVASDDFTYNGESGPDHWGEHYNKCDGKYQSPINIDVLHVVDREFNVIEFRNFDTTPVHGEVTNNGHTVLVKLDFGTNPPTVSGGPFEEGSTFVFVQFHFHWGENDTVGSEDRINNKSFPAELHMVFRNQKYASFEEAINESDGVVVLAYFYELLEEDNQFYEEFTELLAEVEQPGMTAAFHNPPQMQHLISSDVISYFTYTGSLTTPPCSEDVTWVDFDIPIWISARQIERFRRLYTHDSLPLNHNFRPVQPLNNRTVYRAIPIVDNDLLKIPHSAVPFVEVPQRESDSTIGTQPPAPMLIAAIYCLSRLLYVV